LKIRESIYRLLFKFYYKLKFKFVVKYNDFDPKRKDPYILVGNHSCLHDGIFISTLLRKPPVPVINAFLFVSPFTKFLLTKMYPSIPKRKGQSDLVTVRSMMRTLKGGRGVMLFPEGNSSYYGKESTIPFSTVKFFKKVKRDIVVVKNNGGYLVNARWGAKDVKRGLIEVEFFTLFKGEELEKYSLDEIYSKLQEAIKFNDYDWNREKKHEYNPKKRALGLEKFMYVCPKCNSHQTISTKGNKVFCKNCGEIAHFNKYCLLEGLEFDNLVDWGEYQKNRIPEISKKILYTFGDMFDVDVIKYEKYKIGYVDIEFIENTLHVQHRDKEYSFSLAKIENITLTLKREISFNYEDKTYLFVLRDPMLIYDVVKYKMEELV